ncbi:MAG TPA: BREX-2 system phosphatase PglZ, partial [Acidimicrobiales bacterium]
MPTADLARVRAMVAAYGATDERPRALALDAEPTWAGPEVIDGDGTAIRVVPCPSPLAVRAALVDHHRDDEVLVVLTPCRSGELGLDVRARLVKGNVLPLDPFSAVLAVFRARVLDPQLATERWLIDDLVALAPSGGWVDRVPLGGVLDIDHAWRTWHTARLRLDDEPASLVEILRLGADTSLGAAAAELDEDRRRRLGDRWAATLGPAAPVLVDLLADGAGGSLAALGLVAGLLWTPTDDPVLAETQLLGRARLEDWFGRDRLDTRAAGQWAAAATELLDASPQVLDAADRVLVDKDLTPLAVLSDHLHRGFELRLQALARALDAGRVDDAAHALTSLEQHELARRRSPRVKAAAAAVRLLRRGTNPVAPPTTFAAAAEAYARDWAFVDEALRLLREGDSLPELSAAYARLSDAIATERTAAGATFTTLLAEWSAAEPVPDPRIVPLEHLLDEIVAPVATAAPVLLVVCDGMSLPVAHELIRDLIDERWAPASPADRDTWPT